VQTLKIEGPDSNHIGSLQHLITSLDVPLDERGLWDQKKSVGVGSVRKHQGNTGCC